MSKITDIDLEEMSEYVPVNQEDLFAKERLKDFIFMAIETNLVFECPHGEGVKIIQRMRVRLSKLRKIAIKRNRVIDEFKMLLISINQFEDENKIAMERVTLRKSKSKITDISRELNKITEEFPIVAGTKIGQIPRNPMPDVTNLKIGGHK